MANQKDSIQCRFLPEVMPPEHHAYWKEAHGHDDCRKADRTVETAGKHLPKRPKHSLGMAVATILPSPTAAINVLSGRAASEVISFGRCRRGGI